MDGLFPVMNLSQEWRNQRRLFHQYYTQASLYQYHWSQLRQARAFVGWVLESPMADVQRLIRQFASFHPSRMRMRAHMEIVHRFTTAVIVEVSYGKTLSGPDDEYINVAQKFVEGFDAATVPGWYWVEYFPFLRHVPGWVPGTAAKQLQREYGQCTERLRSDAYEEVKRALVSHLQFVLTDDSCENCIRMLAWQRRPLRLPSLRRYVRSL